MHDPIYCSVAITENLAIPRLRYPEFRKDLKTEKTALTFTDIEFLISKNSRSMIKVIMYVFLHQEATCFMKFAITLDKSTMAYVCYPEFYICEGLYKND